MSYAIVRMYQAPSRDVIRRGLEEAQAHCRNPETSSTSTSGKSRTDQLGAWFDGYEEE